MIAVLGVEPSFIFTFAKAGNHFAAGSSKVTFPSSTSIISAVPLIDFVIDAIQNTASFAIGFPPATSAIPTAS